MNFFYTLILIFTLVGCAADNDSDVTENTDQPIGSVLAIPVYNQAYNENYDSDQIDDILLNANNGYVLLDPFQDGVIEAIDEIKANGNEVGAYISVGTGEVWRDDFADLHPYLVSLEWDEWKGEYFVSETSTEVIDVMKNRIDKIAAWGFDWIEFDNMDWVDDYARETYGVQASRAESIAYFQELCSYVHQIGMKCMSKNTVEGADDFDGVTYESYNIEKNWWDNDGAQSFLDEGKMVLIVHYNETECNDAYSDYMGIYNMDLSFICEDANLEQFVHYND
ncbi:endo alpha-1,4 polygalactosaminidase [Vibrio sp. OPT10]|uniref:endo alpha-1,4 polygalactosaminidase n=1 Tax=Vibrio sp. OPT10 TaxID=2778640 RepID=UPI00187F0800|nr:endo alpha-1,4 polygalactosaminidase [Vibrio sp. OPT10]MBE8607527.1 endo alpha-1,4 polygalactosaminidase [Vibrio sp. OPT10]